ncbi:MAG: TonB-dependent receptor [Nevskiaceae bacterium]|jgi:outer membrane receptor protein involved in Fe transport|nr:TonB-dependent receptor [Nevskiaceae bacterium]
MNRCAYPLLCLAVATAVGVAVPAWAADEPDPLAEVIVTASLTGSRLLELPSSVSILDSQTLTQAGVAHFADILGQVPNLFFAGGSSRPRYFQIRGIGESEQYEGAPNPSVGFLIDDIDFSGIAMAAALFDVERAEVLRGPQGTAYGANALAGLISLRSQAPRDEFGLQGEIEVGNYDTYAAGIALNTPLGDDGRTALRIAAHHYESDGFRRNTFLNRRDTNGFDEDLLRLRLRSQISDVLQLDLTALYANTDNGYDAWSVDNSRVTLSDKPGVDSQRSRALALRLTYSGFDAFELHSTTTWLRADMDMSFDADWANDGYWAAQCPPGRLAECVPYDYFSDIARQRQNITQELRFSSTTEGPWSWVAGLYGLHMTEDYTSSDLIAGVAGEPFDSNYRALTLAAYGQIDRRLNDALRLSMGLRVEQRDARYDNSDALRAKPRDTMAGGHVSLDWQFAERQSAYAAITRGYKAGGVNTDSELPDQQRLYNPESLWSAEVGHRYQSPDRTFSARTSVFYMRRYDQQVSGSYQTTPGDANSFMLYIDNAASGDNFGVESQLDWRATRTLSFGANIGLLRARLLNYEQEGVVLDGRDQEHSPRYQISLNAEWRHQGFFARADWQAVDDSYFSTSHDERAPAYQLMNLRLGYEADKWSVSLWARNLFDEQYAVHGFFFANEPPDWVDTRYIQNGDPRQVGVRLTFAPW